MTTTLSVELVPLDDLRPDPANPRRISEDELDALERSLRQFGFVQPVLARREDRTVIGGHQRLVAARRLGLTTVPVTWLDVATRSSGRRIGSSSGEPTTSGDTSRSGTAGGKGRATSGAETATRATSGRSLGRPRRRSIRS